jgi:hypothetical protein
MRQYAYKVLDYKSPWKSEVTVAIIFLLLIITITVSIVLVRRPHRVFGLNTFIVFQGAGSTAWLGLVFDGYGDYGWL